MLGSIMIWDSTVHSSSAHLRDYAHDMSYSKFLNSKNMHSSEALLLYVTHSRADVVHLNHFRR